MATYKPSQDILVSGTNIKTVNSTSLLGSGNIDISGGGTSYQNAIDEPPESAHSMDDEFDGTSLDAKWTTLYKTANDDVAVSTGHLILESPLSEQHRILAVVQAPPSGNWMATTQFNIESLSWNFFGVGLIARNSSNAKSVWCGLMAHSNLGMFTGSVQRLNGETFASETDLCNFQNQHGYLRIEYNASTSTLNWYISVTGVRFRKMYSCTVADFLSLAPDQIGIMIHPWDDTGSGWGGLATFDWFRVTE